MKILNNLDNSINFIIYLFINLTTQTTNTHNQNGPFLPSPVYRHHHGAKEMFSVSLRKPAAKI